MKNNSITEIYKELEKDEYGFYIHADNYTQCRLDAMVMGLLPTKETLKLSVNTKYDMENNIKWINVSDLPQEQIETLKVILVTTSDDNNLDDIEL